ncbi:phosphate propanoyltransferase [Shewanella sp. D64]|uniref:phosphate propanoyltransferase n=1 Tax=unclassified Shewanella TaxID=196818 RepID=UPI0022BA125D|nr:MULTISPECIES: phosphate propanoyltransferase [unclassified Shewanella]MEC4725577.1 phosphate propanoyltransferase [Shewanella sp. D64]MEC4739629.1 phosphate propanoyltransferase [Shewanella sp. E94]WBJ94904.1 phosphate propanoyltransferase [Shewanella sp. MTB7]
MTTQLEAFTNEIIGKLRSRDIPIGISNRHVHLCEKDYQTLFPNEPISISKMLTQPGHFASNQSVALIGPKGSIEKVRLLGPLRPKTQVEISLTNARELGVHGVIRQSGDLSQTPGIIISSDDGEVKIDEGVIVAKRHIHMSTLDALIFGLKDKQCISVYIGSGARKTRFDQVTVRADPNSRLEMHLDTDEANAIGLSGKSDFATILKDG